MSSTSSKPKSILKRRKQLQTNEGQSHKRSRNENRGGVSFNANTEESTSETPRYRKKNVREKEDYDSDDLYDGLASSGGEQFSLESASRKARSKSNDDSDDDDQFSKDRQRLLEKRRRMKEGDDSGDDNDDYFHQRNRNSSGDCFKGEEPNASTSEFSLFNENEAYDANNYDVNGNLKKGLGSGNDNKIPIEPFNMIQEREGGGGYFDGDTYVFRKAASDQDVDAWVDSLEDITQNPNESKVISKQQKPPVEEKIFSKDELLSKLHKYLSHGDETIQLAIQRYGREKKQIKQQLKTNQNDEKLKLSLKSIDSSLNEVIECANAMLMMDDGYTDIYEYSKHRIASILSLPIPSDSMEKEANAAPAKQVSYFQEKDVLTQKDTNTTTKISHSDLWEWEYRGNEDNEIHGPYTTEQMHAWTQAGYFVNENAVDVRKKKKIDIGNNDASEQMDDLMNDLLSDEEEEEIEWVKSDKIDFSSYL